MEPVTHFLTGACLGRSGFNRKTAYATLAMTLAAEAPDLDVLWSFRGPVTGFEHHRGITHTLIAAPVMALVTTAFIWLLHRFRRKPPAMAPRWWLIWLFALIADLSHLLLDFTNNYGLRPFFPFSGRWYAWSTVFIFEPLMFAALLGALILPGLFALADREVGAKRKPFRGRGWAIAALSFIVVLYGVRSAEHAHAMELAQNANLTREPVLRVTAEPYPINPFAWHVILETQDYYQTAEVQTRGDRVEAGESGGVIYKPPVTPAVAAAKQSYLGRVYLDWSAWPVVEDHGAMTAPGKKAWPPQQGWHTVEFRDLRFAYSVLSSQNGQKDPPLSAWVYVGPAGSIEGMFMSGQEQN